MPRAVLFDLDGTLVDSLGDIAGALNHVLEEAGLPPHPLPAYKTLVGEGARELVRRALPPGREAMLDDLLARYRARYGEHLLATTRPYDGIEALLAELERRAIPKAVVTNKPHAPASAIVEALLGRYAWSAIEGQQEGRPHKPDPAVALAIARTLGVPPSECLFVGDSDVDMKTATRAGMVAVGVAWGLRDRGELIASGAAAVIDHPRDLLRLLV